MKLTKEQKQRIHTLIDALNSNQYKKGVGGFRDSNNNYCALGVACDISGLGSWISLSTRYGYKIENSDSLYSSVYSSSFLTEPVMEYYGFDNDSVKLKLTDGEIKKLQTKYNDILINVIIVNDSGLFSFKEIARMIKRTYLK